METRGMAETQEIAAQIVVVILVLVDPVQVTVTDPIQGKVAADHMAVWIMDHQGTVVQVIQAKGMVEQATRAKAMGTAAVIVATVAATVAAMVPVIHNQTNTRYG